LDSLDKKFDLTTPESRKRFKDDKGKTVDYLTKIQRERESEVEKTKEIKELKKKLEQERIERELIEGYKAKAKLNLKICEDFKFVDGEIQ